MSSHPSLGINPKTGEDQYPSSMAVKQRKQILLGKIFLFCSFSAALEEAHTHGEDHLLYSFC
jgi:hypothetical protein